MFGVATYARLRSQRQFPKYLLYRARLGCVNFDSRFLAPVALRRSSPTCTMLTRSSNALEQKRCSTKFTQDERARYNLANNLSFGFICLSFNFFRHLFDFSPRQDARPDIALGSKAQKYARNILESHRQMNQKLRLTGCGYSLPP